MKLDRIVLILSGLAGIAAFFLPFINQDYLLGGEMAASGYNYVMTSLDASGTLEFEEGRNTWNLVWDFIKSAGSPADYAAIAGTLFTLAGPFLFLLFSFGYIIRGLRGKQYRNGIFLSLLFLGIAWASFYFLGASPAQTLFTDALETPLNFFSMAGLGFWLAFGSMITAAFSLFFAKNLE